MPHSSKAAYRFLLLIFFLGLLEPTFAAENHIAYESLSKAYLGCGSELSDFREQYDDPNNTPFRLSCEIIGSLQGYRLKKEYTATNWAWSSTYHAVIPETKRFYENRSEALQACRSAIPPFPGMQCVEESDQRSSYITVTVSYSGTSTLWQYRFKPINAPYIVSVSSPSMGGQSLLGDSVLFSAEAYDPVYGDISFDIIWESNIQGIIGSGARFYKDNLIAGKHRIEAVIKVFGIEDRSGPIDFEVVDRNAPNLSIVSPTSNQTFFIDEPISFSATATDSVDGDISSQILWTGTGISRSGASFNESFSTTGQETITARVLNSYGQESIVSRSFTVEEHELQLSDPRASLEAEHEAYMPVPLYVSSATLDGVDSKDQVEWSSSLDGALGTGGAISPYLSPGTHVISAKLSKYGKEKVTETVVTIVEDFPHLQVAQPLSGRIFDIDEPVSFEAEVSFRGQPTSNATINWYSSLDGQIGSGSQFSRDEMSEGQHLVEVSAAENGQTRSQLLYLTVYDSEKNLGDENDGQCMGGNPINLLTGNKYHEEQDFSTATEMPLFVTRSYNSASKEIGLFGYGWSSNIEERVEHNATSEQAEVVEASGAVQRFDLESGDWVDSSSQEGSLERLAGGGWRYTRYDGTIKTYNSQGQILWIQALNKLRLTYTYENGKLTSIEDAYGHVVTFTYNANGFIETFTDPDSYVYTFGYLNENLTSVTYPDTTLQDNSDNPTKTYHYEDGNHPHALTGLTDEENIRFATWTYDAYGRATSSVHNGGAEEFSISFNPDGTVNTTNALNKRTTYHYSSVKGLLKVTDVQGHQSTHCAAASASTEYDPGTGFADSKTDWRGNTTLLDHNVYGQVTSITTIDTGKDWSAEPIDERVTITTQYNALRLPWIIEKPGLTTELEYTGNGRLDVVTRSDTTTHSDPYSTSGQSRVTDLNYTFHVGTKTLKQVEIDGPRIDKLDVHKKTYDLYGNLIEERNALGHVTTYRNHTARGLPQQIEDPNGLIIDLEYNARGWLKKRIERSAKGDAITTYTHYKNGLPKKTTHSDGTSETLHYNGARQLVKLVNNEGEEQVFTPNKLNGKWKTKSYSDSSGQETFYRTRQFDALGRVRLDLSNQGHRTEYEYDPNGNVILEAQQITFGQENDVRLTVNSYDAKNRLRGKTSDDQPTVSYHYDAAGNLVEIKASSGDDQLIRYVHNGFGEVVYSESPATGAKTLFRDQAGNVIKEVNSAGQEIVKEYDALNRLEDIKYQGAASENVSYVYDAPAVNGIGRLTSLTDESGNKSLAYDDQGYLDAVYYTIGSASFDMNYSFDKTGQLTNLVYPSGRSVDYGYDSSGRPSELEIDGTKTLISSAGYYPFGPLKDLSFGHGLRRVMNVDDRYRPSRLDHHWLSQTEQIDYGLDTADRIREQIRALQSGNKSQTLEAKRYQYDFAGRLTEAHWEILNGESSPNEFLTYGYDDFGNRTSKQQRSAIHGVNKHWSYSVDSTSNKVDSLSVSNDGVNYAQKNDYSYEPTGQTSSDGEQSWTYNNAQRMSSVKEGAQVKAEYLYNEAGQRVQKIVGTDITRFHYDLNGELIAETDGQGNLVREYFYLGAMPVAMITGPSVWEGVASSEDRLVGSDHIRIDTSDGEKESVLQRTIGDALISGEITSADLSDAKGKVGLTLREEQGGDSGAKIDVFLAATEVSNVTMIQVKTPEGRLVPIPMFSTSVGPPEVEIDITYSGGTSESYVATAKGNYLKLDRTGARIDIYSSADGNGWALAKSIDVPMLDEVYIGAIAANAKAEINTNYEAANDELFYLHTDHLNSVYAVSNNLTRNVVWQRQDFKTGASPFGLNTTASGEVLHAGLFEMPLRFPGQYYDVESGKHYNYFRDYDPFIGRYLQSDPIGLAGGLNTYLYAGAAPLNHTDSKGLFIDAAADLGFILYDLYRIGADNIFGDCGNFNENAIALGADVGGLFTPFASGLGMASRVGTRVTDSAVNANKVAGDLGEDAVRLRLLNSNSVDIVGEQLRINTPGIGSHRVTDFLVRGKTTGKLRIIEVKTGGATRSSSQFAKDSLIADPSSATTFSGRRARASGLTNGTPTGGIQTYEVNASNLNR